MITSILCGYSVKRNRITYIKVFYEKMHEMHDKRKRFESSMPKHNVT